jgi:PAS domain S-box-containing protein
VIRRLFLACLLALLVACSAMEFAYNNADSYVRWQAGRYLDLKNAQAEEFNARLAKFLAWHRSTALTQYARLAGEASGRLERGASLADMVWGYDAIRQQAREGLRRAGAETGDFLDRLTPAQIEHLERRFAEDNAKFAREWLEGTPDEQRARRLKRLTHTLEDWLGELSDAQRERVRQFNDAAPLNGEMRDRERRRRQAEFVAMLRARESARRLADWVADWDRGHDPAFVRANREFTDGLLAMLAELERGLSPRQRAVAVARLREHARDFQVLAAARDDRTAPPDTLEQPPASYAGRTRFTQLEYEAVLANASIGIAFTRDRKFFLCNPKFAEMFGWQPDELIGQPGEAVYPSRESYDALSRIAVPVLLAGKQLDLEWEVRRKDGSTFLARMIAKAISSADPRRGTVWIVEDVTVAKRHADEVARLLREQEAIFETASIGIVFVRDRRVVRCNARYEQMYGYAPGELAGKPTSIFFASEEDHRDVEEAYAQFRSGISYQNVSPRKRKDGSVMWVRTIGRAIDARDPHRGSVWTNEDITEQQRASEQLERLLAEQEALLNNVVVGISFARGRQVLRCRRFEELFGYDPERADRRLDAPVLLHRAGVRAGGPALR